MRHKIGLRKAWPRVGPLSEGPYRHVFLQQPARLRRPNAVRLLALAERLQQAVSGGRTDAQQLLAHCGVQDQMPVALERGHQLGQKRHQPLGADLVGRGPGDAQGLLDRGSVVPLARAQNRRR